MNTIILAIVAVLAPFVCGLLAGELAKFNGFLNKLRAPIPALIGVVVAFGLSALSQWLGVALPGDLAGLNQDVLVALLTALAQFFVPVTAALKGVRARMGLKR
jgi:hypothetical protein